MVEYCKCGITWVTNNNCDSCGKPLNRMVKDLKQGERVLVAGLDMYFYEMRNDSPVFCCQTDTSSVIYYHIKDYNQNTPLSDIR